ncbi:hypothetical protein AOR13_2929 [Alteromonas stellipolaris LMG 21856]|nr:hypothetical protein AOR13_2929 [Alteromonas stellipolaris LMG 21856]
MVSRYLIQRKNKDYSTLINNFALGEIPPRQTIISKLQH